MAKRFSQFPKSVQDAIIRHGLITGQTTTTRHGNRRTVDAKGEAYDSLHERRVIEWIEAEGYTVIRQVSMPIAPRVRIRVDGLVILERYDDGTFRGKFIDPKGHLTDAARVKLAAFEQRYGVHIHLIKKGE